MVKDAGGRWSCSGRGRTQVGEKIMSVPLGKRMEQAVLVGMGIVGVYSSKSSVEGSTVVEDSEMGGEEMRAARAGGGTGTGNGESKV